MAAGASAAPLTLAECADGARLPEGAAALLASLPPAEALADDALFALVVVLLAEAGFELDDAHAHAPTRCDEGFNAGRVAALRALPPGWRRPASATSAGPGGPPPPQRQVALRLPGLAQHRVRLVGVSVGGALVANVLLQPGDDAGPHSLCLGLRAPRFLEASRGAWKARRLGELSRRVKDVLATPARCLILRAEGLRYPALDGLPEEVLLRVAHLLPAPSLLALGSASKGLLELSREPGLWRALLRRDFGVTAEGGEAGATEADGGAAGAEDPLAAYRRRYERERLWWRDRDARQRWLRNMRHTDRGPSSDSDSSLPPPPPPPSRLPPVWYLRADGLPRRGPSPGTTRISAELWRLRRHQRASRRVRPVRAPPVAAAISADADADADAEIDADEQFRDASSEEALYTTRTSQSAT